MCIYKCSRMCVDMCIYICIYIVSRCLSTCVATSLSTTCLHICFRTSRRNRVALEAGRDVAHQQLEARRSRAGRPSHLADALANALQALLAVGAPAAAEAERQLRAVPQLARASVRLPGPRPGDEAGPRVGRRAGRGQPLLLQLADANAQVREDLAGLKGLTGKRLMARMVETRFPIWPPTISTFATQLV